MDIQNMTEELLHQLIKLLGCRYISDLRCQYWQAAIHLILSEIAPGDYPLEAWRSAAEYIFGAVDKEKITSAEDAYYFFFDESVESEKGYFRIPGFRVDKNIL